MESNKRKRPPFADAAGVKEGKVARKSDGGGDRDLTAVNDAEVEEFFAILRRMREAAKCAAAAKAAAKSKEERLRWKPAFVWEDFEEADSAGKDGGDGKKEAEDGNRRCLDHNADPTPDGP